MNSLFANLRNFFYHPIPDPSPSPDIYAIQDPDETALSQETKYAGLDESNVVTNGQVLENEESLSDYSTPNQSQMDVPQYIVVITDLLYKKTYKAKVYKNDSVVNFLSKVQEDFGVSLDECCFEYFPYSDDADNSLDNKNCNVPTVSSEEDFTDSCVDKNVTTLTEDENNASESVSSLENHSSEYVQDNPSSLMKAEKEEKCYVEVCGEKDKLPLHVKCMNYIGDSKWEDSESGEEVDLNKPIILDGRLHANVDDGCSNAVSSLIPKISKFNLQTLDIYDQTLTSSECKSLLTDSVKHLNLQNTSIKDCQGSMVTADKLIVDLSNLEECHIDCSGVAFKYDTVRKISQNISGLKKLNIFHLYGLTESFQFLSLNYFLLKNESVEVRLIYDVCAPLSDSYKSVLDNFFENVVANPPKKIPTIEIPGYKGAKYEEYRKLL